MANIKLFNWDGLKIELNIPEIILIPEFKNLMELDKKDGEGTAWKHFTYLYLAFDNLSPYGELTEEDRIQTAFEDSGLTDDQVSHGIMLAATSKYISLQVTGIVRLLRAAQSAVENMTDTLKSINLNERTNSNGLVYKASDIIKQIKDLADVHEGITKLEFQVRQEREMSKGVRGDNEVGFKN